MPAGYRIAELPVLPKLTIAEQPDINFTITVATHHRFGHRHHSQPTLGSSGDRQTHKVIKQSISKLLILKYSSSTSATSQACFGLVNTNHGLSAMRMSMVLKRFIPNVRICKGRRYLNQDDCLLRLRSTTDPDKEYVCT